MQACVRVAKRFIIDESGMETLEYAIIAGLVVAGTLGALAAFGIWVAGIYTTTQATVGA